MIIGLGSDICDIRRIEATLARYGARFTARVFTPGEQAKADRRAARAAMPGGVMATRRAAAPPASRMVGWPEGRFTTSMSRQNTP